jgi:hypothetical protein
LSTIKSQLSAGFVPVVDTTTAAVTTQQVITQSTIITDAQTTTISTVTDTQTTKSSDTNQGIFNNLTLLYIA